MGPFGSGKSYLGRQLRKQKIAEYLELEPIIYNQFEKDGEFDVDGATAFLKASYYEQLSNRQKVVAFESTGVVQRPFLLEVMAQYTIGLVRVSTPKRVCLRRVTERNKHSKHPIEMTKADEFYDFWTDEIAPTYQFSLVVDGQDAQSAIQDIQILIAGV